MMLARRGMRPIFRTAFANPEAPDKVVKRRIHDGESAEFDLRSGNGDAVRKGPGYSQRYENRARLKTRVLRGLWGKT